MNNPFVQEQAAGLARRLIAASCDPTDRIVSAYQLAWSRPPTHDERDRAIEFLRKSRVALVSVSAPADSREREAWTSLAKVMLTANEFLYID